MSDASTAQATQQYTEGNKLDRSAEVAELAQGLAKCLVAGQGGDVSKKSLGETSLSAAFQAKADQSAHFVHQGMAITDQIHDTLSKTRQHKLEELYASTRRLQEMFDVTDEKYNRLMAFCSHIEKIQARLRLVRAAKEKKYPRHLKFQKILVNSLTSVVNGRKRYDDTNIEATHSNIYLNLPDWEPIAPFAPKAGPEAESSTSSRIPLDQQSRNTKIGNIAEGKP